MRRRAPLLRAIEQKLFKNLLTERSHYFRLLLDRSTTARLADPPSPPTQVNCPSFSLAGSIAYGRSAIAEVYPALWNRGIARGDGTADQHDAFSIAAWLAAADWNGSLSGFLQPSLRDGEKAKAGVEGWILGVAGTLDEPGHLQKPLALMLFG